MIIRIDWFNCNALPKWDAKIHKMLEEIVELKPQISHASVRTEEIPDAGQRFHLVTMLRMPGPDIIAHGKGQTFEEAMLKMATKIRRTLTTRTSKALQFTGAACGVKTSFRG